MKSEVGFEKIGLFLVATFLNSEERGWLVGRGAEQGEKRGKGKSKDFAIHQELARACPYVL